MATIHLSKGRSTTIDDESLRLVSPYRWYFDRYVFTYDEFGRKLYLHRLVMGEPNGIVDHKFGDVFDNRIDSLRLANHSENMRNRPVRSDSQSGLKGVAIKLGKTRITHEAYIYLNGRRIGLGTYRNKISAAFARDFAARRVEGEFAWCHFPSLSTPSDIQRTVRRKLARHGY